MKLLSAVVITIALLSADCDASRYGRQHRASSYVYKKYYFRGDKIPCWKSVQYSVVNDCDWNSVRHPRDYPSDAHWSPLCGTTHKDEGAVFEIGGISSDGVKQVAETGNCATLQSEVSECAGTYSCGDFLRYPCSATDGTCKHEGTFYATKRYPYLTVLSMAAPSPDWFVGVNSVNLCKDGYWIPSYEKYLLGNDAGTDGGPTFKSPDMSLSPRQPIFVFDGKDESNIFYNNEQGNLHALCKITITLKSK